MLNITVTDDGAAKAPATPAPGTGFGLIGMRERAHSVGGDLAAGRRPEGGFEVATALPLYPQSPEKDRRLGTRIAGSSTGAQKFGQ